MDSRYSSAAKGILDLDLITTAVFLTDSRGAVLYANASAEILTGLSKNTICGQDASLFFRALPQWLKRFSPGGAEPERQSQDSISEIVNLYVPQYSEAGHPVRAAVSAGPLIRGQPTLLIEFTDYEMTLLAARQEHQFGFSEANRQVLRNLAHEIKNPLGGIRGAAQLLDSELTNPELREYTSVIIGEADRLQGLVDKLLEPYRAKRQVTSVNIHEVLERVRQLLLAEFPQGLTFERDYDVSVPDVSADREQLIQVFLNLARNAAEALEEKIKDGTARIRLTTRVVQQAVIGMRRYRLALSVHVIDNGPGVPPDIKDRIFFPLVTGKPQGSGLGLSLAQNFIQQQGGTIDVDSVPGRTDFSVLIPISEPSK